MRMTRMIGCIFGLSLVLISTQTGWTDSALPASDSLVAHLPEGAVATLEFSNLAPLIERIETSPALRELLSSPQWSDALKLDPVQKALGFKSLAEGQLGMSLWQFAKTYFGDRIVLGIYPPTQPGSPPDGVLILRVKDAASLATLRGRLTPLLPLAGDKIRLSARDDGGHTVTMEDGNQAVIRDQWIVISKQKPLLDRTLQSLAIPAASGDSVATSAEWKQMATQLGTDHDVQFFLNMTRLTGLVGHRLIPPKLDNGVVSLLLGGYLELAAGSPYVGSTLDIRDNHFELRSTVAGNPGHLDAAHQPFVLEGDPAPRADVPATKNPLNGFSITRDFSAWYRNREALLEASLLPGFDKFETGLATFLPGRDFGEDVLPLLGNRLTLVTAPQSFAHLRGTPGVQLPGIALLLDLAKPAEANDVLSLVFQTIVLVSNLQAMQENRQPFVLSSETYRNTQVAFAKYVKQPEGPTLPISYNFQPASARVGDRYVIATNVEMCHQLIDIMHNEANAPAADQPTRVEGVRDVYFDLSPTAAADLLELNSQVLHAQNLQQGKSQEQSVQELQALLKLLRQLTPVSFSSTRFADRWQLEFQGGWK